MTQPTAAPNHTLRATLWGAASIGMYALLFLHEEEVLHLSSQGKWYFLFPLLTAFAFSFVHGNFTGEFWRSLGIRARR